MILVLLAAAAAQPQAESSKAFLERVYAAYHTGDFSPFEHADLYFAPRLKAAIDADSLLAKGEVGYLDGDPICQCQDADGLRAKIIRVRVQGKGRAIAEVLLDYPDSTARRISFSLVQTRAGWRIADVIGGYEPSLLRAIEASNRAARAKR